MQPNLTKNMSVQSFIDFYWLKDKLQVSCRNNGECASDSKIELSDRIETFLQTRKIKKLSELQGST